VTAVSIPIPLSSSPGAFPQESAGRLINCYAEPLGKDVEAKKGFVPPVVVWRKSPGLSLQNTSTQTGFRGGLLVGSALYTAWSGKAATYTSTGTEAVLTGTLNGTEKVFWAREQQDADAGRGLCGAWDWRVLGFVNCGHFLRRYRCWNAKQRQLHGRVFPVYLWRRHVAGVRLE